MIKFFRKFRQQLLAEKKISKYLIYAIGEIVLVVIGILIALSINNWNTKRIEAFQNEEYNNRLMMELEFNKNRLDSILIPFYLKQQSHVKTLIEIVAFPECKSADDSLEIFNAWVNFNHTKAVLGLKTSVYDEGIFNQRIYKFINEEKTSSIINFYEHYKNVQMAWEMRDLSRYQSTLDASIESYSGLMAEYNLLNMKSKDEKAIISKQLMEKHKWMYSYKEKAYTQSIIFLEAYSDLIEDQLAISHTLREDLKKLINID